MKENLSIPIFKCKTKLKMKKLLTVALSMAFAIGYAQDYFPAHSEVKTTEQVYRAFTGATIHVDPTTVIENGTLLIYNDEVVSVGKKVQIPSNAIVTDLSGTHIYPSFIEVFSELGVEKPKRQSSAGRSAQYEPTREGFYWNDHIRSETNAIDFFTYNSNQSDELRKAGFGVVNTHRADGIARGTSLLVALDDKGDASSRILDDRSGSYFSFSKSIQSTQSYPSSLMGAMALLRQLNHDLNWYASGNVTTKDRALEALIAQKQLPQFFEAGANGNTVRALKIGQQFGIKYHVLGSGDEYQYVRELKNFNASVVVPLNFPKAYDVSDPTYADYVSLKDMRHWYQAPSNAKILRDHEIRIAFTTQGLKSANQLKTQVALAMERGLSEADALAALTTVPAEILGKQSEIGALKQGMKANFTVTSGPIFENETTLFEHWVNGHKHLYEDRNTPDLRGEYILNHNDQDIKLNINGSIGKPKVTATRADEKLKVKSNYANYWLSVSLSDSLGQLYRATLKKEGDLLSGRFVDENGDSHPVSMVALASTSESKNKDSEELVSYNLKERYPNVGYGYTEQPKAEEILFKNSTVWTGTEILENTDVHIKSGKIQKVGKDLKAKSAQVIDATGKHLTAGIIDEHTHIAALAINEGGHNSSAEVRMSDVVDPTDLDIYRNLAGGVTSAQLLHGSANPIGGQSAILRLKWGATADEMLFKEAPGFIKFALGENVKQSNWGSNSRFPQTRMGVEQVFTDYFTRGKEYLAKKKSKQPYRIDEELETIGEILESKRFISSHSYVQSEINMLMKVAEKFDFRINTFTHILEGYKVANKMAEHGVGGSTFSDWWAYKYEVKDAIPYNAAIMASQGVTVAINSDDAEMSRRLNQEAAKTVKYGGVSELEAWKMVTLNPAKLLHIDHKVGSIEVGKDADVVLWSGHPLSVYSKAEKTIIEGATYFDIEKDKEIQASIQQERLELTKLMLKVKASGAEVVTPIQNKKERFTCDTL